MHETDRRDVWFNNVDLLQRSDYQQLQAQLLKKLQAVPSGFIRAPSKRLVNENEAERTRSGLTPF
jgi:hypothetical protein